MIHTGNATWYQHRLRAIYTEAQGNESSKQSRDFCQRLTMIESDK